MDMFTLYGHFNRGLSQNRITDFFMILAWASPFTSAGPYIQKSYGPLKLTFCVKNKDIAQSVAQR